MKPVGVELIRPGDPVRYEHGLELQRACVRERKEGVRPDTLILLEHTPVITLGRNADPSGVVASAQDLRSLEIQVHRAERGGQATYHGPGQVVGYPILDLCGLGIGVREYVNALEEVMLRAAGAFGVPGFRIPGKPGVFCAQGKLGAVGVAVSRGVTSHGFAFNASLDLAPFQLIVPCGLADTPVVSVASVTGEAPGVPETEDAVVTAWAEVFGARPLARCVASSGRGLSTASCACVA